MFSLIIIVPPSMANGLYDRFRYLGDTSCVLLAVDSRFPKYDDSFYLNLQKYFPRNSLPRPENNVEAIAEALVRLPIAPSGTFGFSYLKELIPRYSDLVTPHPERHVKLYNLKSLLILRDFLNDPFSYRENLKQVTVAVSESYNSLLNFPFNPIKLGLQIRLREIITPEEIARGTQNLSFISKTLKLPERSFYEDPIASSDLKLNDAWAFTFTVELNLMVLSTEGHPARMHAANANLLYAKMYIETGQAKFMPEKLTQSVVYIKDNISELKTEAEALYKAIPKIENY